ncbi:MAG: hypothetical protein KDA61_21440, partial [Planctomycetales bacterium]|nr:hypothetical protein [Planctomycetales bacterium]
MQIHDPLFGGDEFLSPAPSQSDVREGVSLDSILGASRRVGASDARIYGCSSDWRQVQPGDVF